MPQILPSYIRHQPNASCRTAKAPLPCSNACSSNRFPASQHPAKHNPLPCSANPCPAAQISHLISQRLLIHSHPTSSPALHDPDLFPLTHHARQRLPHVPNGPLSPRDGRRVGQLRERSGCTPIKPSRRQVSISSSDSCSSTSAGDMGRVSKILRAATGATSPVVQIWQGSSRGVAWRCDEGCCFLRLRNDLSFSCAGAGDVARGGGRHVSLVSGHLEHL